MLKNSLKNSLESEYCINSLFSPNRLSYLEGWECIYNTTLDIFNENLRLAGLDADYESHLEATTADVLEMNVVSLIESMSARLSEGSPQYGEFVTLRDLFNENRNGANRYNTNFLWHVFNLLKELNSTIDYIDMDDYNSMVSFDYAELVNKNIYNGLFASLDYLNGTKNPSYLLRDLSRQMAMLSVVNPSLYNEFSHRYFNRSEFDGILALNATLHAEIMGYYDSQPMFDAWAAGFNLILLHHRS